MKIRLLLIQFLSTFPLVFLPLCFIAEKVQPGDVVSITTSFQDDEVYLPKVVYNSKHREYLPCYSKKQGQKLWQAFVHRLLVKENFASFPLANTNGKRRIYYF